MFRVIFPKNTLLFFNYFSLGLVWVLLSQNYFTFSNETGKKDLVCEIFTHDPETIISEKLMVKRK